MNKKAEVNDTKAPANMEYIRITKDNLEKEHICCAISNNKDVQVSSKKAWLADRLDDGLVFLKSTERGKCFIEYIPAENAWNPIDADGYMYIDCLWVSGSLKGHGYANDLLGACIEDSKEKGKKGLCILSAAKKKPFLADPKFLNTKGSPYVTRPITGFSFGICLSPPTPCSRSLKTARSIRTRTTQAMCCITQANVRSTRSMFRSWNRQQKNIISRSVPFIWKRRNRRRPLPRRSQLMRCSVTAYT